MRERFVAAVVLGLSAMSAHAASFDCKAVTTKQEKLICATPKLSADDDQMGEAYKVWLAAAPEPTKSEVLANQRAWLVRRAYQCSGPASGPSSKEMVVCLGFVYKDRIDKLQARVKTLGDVTFVSRATHLAIKDTTENAADASMEQVPGYGTLDATWPVAQTDAPEWQKWNAAVETATRKVAAPEGTKTFADWPTRWAAGQDSQTDATVLSVEHGRVGVLMTDSSMEHGRVGVLMTDSSMEHGRVGVLMTDSSMQHGGAHGSFDRVTFYWLLAEGRPLQVSDVFQAGTPWSQPVVAACAQAIVKQLGPQIKQFFRPRNQNIAKVVADVKNWTLTPQGLRISFPEYSVSDYAEPADDVTIPWSTLKGSLASGFVPPA